MAKIKTRLTMGGVLSAAGLWLRAVQIFFMALGVGAATNSMLTLIITCITVGGLCVTAAELRGRCAVLALLCAVFVLCGVMSAGSLKILGAVSMILTFLFFVLLLCTVKRGGAQLISAVIIAVLSVAVLLQLFGVYSIPTVAVSIMLAAIYISMGAGLIL